MVSLELFQILLWNLFVYLTYLEIYFFVIKNWNLILGKSNQEVIF